MRKCILRKKQGWQSLYRVTTIVAVLLLLFVGKIGYKFSLAYQTDASSLKNHFYQDITQHILRTSFPEQSIIPGESKTIEKKVRICNEKDGTKMWRVIFGQRFCTVQEILELTSSVEQIRNGYWGKMDMQRPYESS